MPVRGCGFAVVVALRKLAAAMVADTGDRRRRQEHVEGGVAIAHTRRPLSRRTSSSRGTAISTAASSRQPNFAMRGVQRRGLLRGARETVHDEALLRVRLAQAFLDDRQWSRRRERVRRGPYTPSRPGRPAIRRRRPLGRCRPVAMCGTPNASDEPARLACPYRRRGRRARMIRMTRGSLLDEPAIIAHGQTRFDLVHGVERHADDDEQRRAAEIERGDVREVGETFGRMASRPR